MLYIHTIYMLYVHTHKVCVCIYTLYIYILYIRIYTLSTLLDKGLRKTIKEKRKEERMEKLENIN